MKKFTLEYLSLLPLIPATVKEPEKSTETAVSVPRAGLNPLTAKVSSKLAVVEKAPVLKVSLRESA